MQAVLGLPAAVAASFVWLQQQAAARGQAVQAAPGGGTGNTSIETASTSSSDAGTSSSSTSNSREYSSRHREIEGRNSSSGKFRVGSDSRTSQPSTSQGKNGGVVAAELPKHKKQRQQQGIGQQLTPNPALRKAAVPGAAKGLGSTRQAHGAQTSSQQAQADSTGSSSSRPQTAAAAAAPASGSTKAPVSAPVAVEGPAALSSTGRRAPHAGAAPGQASAAAAPAVEGASLMARARAAAGREAPGDEGDTGEQLPQA